MSNFMKVRPVGVELFHPDGQMDGRMDGHDEANSCFSKFCELGPHRPYSQKSETHWKQGFTLVGRRQGEDNYKSHISFSETQQPNTGLGRLTVEVSGSHTRTHAHTHAAGLLWTSDQFVAEAATYTTHNKHNRRTSMPSAGFELAIPAIKPLQV
jgi:hypothetical protein